MTRLVEDLHFSIIRENGKTFYRWNEHTVYRSPRYRKEVTVPVGFVSDGASGPARDIASFSWWVHDVLCDRKPMTWDDGTKCSNWKASMVLSDILKAEGHGICSRAWKWGTAIGRPVSNWFEALWARIRK